MGKKKNTGENKQRVYLHELPKNQQPKPGAIPRYFFSVGKEKGESVEYKNVYRKACSKITYAINEKGIEERVYVESTFTKRKQKKTEESFEKPSSSFNSRKRLAREEDTADFDEIAQVKKRLKLESELIICDQESQESTGKDNKELLCDQHTQLSDMLSSNDMFTPNWIDELNVEVKKESVKPQYSQSTNMNSLFHHPASATDQMVLTANKYEPNLKVDLKSDTNKNIPR